MNNFSEILKKPKSKVLILRPEGSLGDAILSSGYYQSLKQFNKNIEIKDASMMGLLIDEMKKQGLSEEDIDKVCYKNVLRVFKANFK